MVVGLTDLPADLTRYIGVYVGIARKYLLSKYKLI